MSDANLKNLRAYAHIQCDNLYYNLQQIQSLQPHKTIIIMLKANAYGHGAYEIARRIDGLCQYFGVASLEEGIELRNSGVKHSKIIIFSGFFCQQMVSKLVDYQLIPVIHSLYQLPLLSEYFSHHFSEIWIKVNTGMNRLGLTPCDFEAAYRKLTNYNKPLSLITHLAESEAIDQHFTDKQLQCFQHLIADKQFKHISAFNSAASLLRADDRLTNTIRIGLALYGCCARNTLDLPCHLKPVMSLHSHIIAIQSIKKGQLVGYNCTFKAQADTDIAIASIGYGDGYPQNTPSGSPVMINNKLFYTAGKVSMDLMAINLTANHQVCIGDTITLFGQHATINTDRIAGIMNTSSYALLTGISPRVQRLYQ